MSAAAITEVGEPTSPHIVIRARPSGFFGDMASVSNRALRLLPRDLETILPALLIPLFFLVVTIGAIQNLASDAVPGFDYKAFQLPVALMTAVTGMSRANSLALDIANGYFDRLLMTPINRYALLLGLMVADFVLFLVLATPVIILGFAIGVSFGATGVLGLLVFVLFGAFWGLAYTGFPYAIALRTGNPGAVNSSILLFFPFMFLTTAWVSREVMTDWLAVITWFNPMTYALEAMRSLFLNWDGWALSRGILAVSIVGLLAQTLALRSLNGRVRRG
ncbi:MAG: ABC transporter permease [Acidimicrobiia bacterium]|nr:ABC transporter permease [Acidimicrobiia bacterium]MYC57123.1 ABC transporter permease [Acidimicrobiia bacterium]MYG94775.1 ABC transporter permease [Acidimicrobiia bacterium]MYI30200.1 ABC transporter permease [Acidimicrobiia bacterium]